MRPNMRRRCAEITFSFALAETLTRYFLEKFLGVEAVGWIHWKAEADEIRTVPADSETITNKEWELCQDHLSEDRYVKVMGRMLMADGRRVEACGAVRLFSAERYARHWEPHHLRLEVNCDSVGNYHFERGSTVGCTLLEDPEPIPEFVGRMIRSQSCEANARER